MQNQRYKILLIDDEIMLAKSLARILEDDYEVVMLTDGVRAKKLLQANDSFDLIITDLSMPYINGREIHSLVAKLYPGREADIIYMSGYQSSEELIKFVGQTDNLILAKPFDEKELRRAIDTILHVT